MKFKKSCLKSSTFTKESNEVLDNLNDKWNCLNGAVLMGVNPYFTANTSSGLGKQIITSGSGDGLTYPI